MSVRIIKPGLSDTIQDAGRYGWQHLGINPGGVMDSVAMKIANALVGNSAGEAVLEMHFPAAEMVFEQDVLIALSGADFAAEINGKEIKINHPVIVLKNNSLRFTKYKTGARCYLAVHGGFVADAWLNSYSTHTQLKTGGYHGRALQKNDVIGLHNEYKVTIETDYFLHLPWKASVAEFYHSSSAHFIAGAEYDFLDEGSKQSVNNNPFTITAQSDRMGYRLQGASLQMKEKIELISTGVTKGTIQLLPDGQLIVLMADHQTTGGYPRIGHVSSTAIPSLAQKRPGESFSFQLITIAQAEEQLFQQQQNLQQLQNACNFRLQEYFKNE